MSGLNTVFRYMLHFAFAFCWWICLSLDSYFRCCSEWFGVQKQCVTFISKCWFISRSCGMCLWCTTPLWSKKTISITFWCCTPSMLLSFAKRIFVVMIAADFWGEPNHDIGFKGYVEKLYEAHKVQQMKLLKENLW